MPSTETILPVSRYQRKHLGITSGLSTQKIIYRSALMAQLLETIQKVSPTLSTILVQGESGTGKELVARMIHEKSGRAHRPFVALNCATLKDSLLESELFGHEKGAFTGAVQQKMGLAEYAHGGTLFLDEIGEISLGVQSKLLRFLQEGEFYRVGGKELIRADVRVVLATNRDLAEEVRKGNFREDLYYRISTIVLETPPLRRRKEDIMPLIQHFFLKGHANYGRPLLKIRDEVKEVLLNHDWPGNIRELENLCEMLQVLCDKEEVELSDLPESLLKGKATDVTRDYDPKIKIADLEKVWITKAMEYFRGNKTQAANALGITIKTLYNKLHEYGLFEKYALHSKAE